VPSRQLLLRNLGRLQPRRAQRPKPALEGGDSEKSILAAVPKEKKRVKEYKMASQFEMKTWFLPKRELDLIDW
jgi:hypothetical protein